MACNCFKGENVHDKYAKALSGRGMEAYGELHIAIISREDFEKGVAMRKGNACTGVERTHETHCLTDKNDMLVDFRKIVDMQREK